MAHKLKEKEKLEMRNKWHEEELLAEKLAKERQDRNIQKFKENDISNKAKMAETKLNKIAEKEMDKNMVSAAIKKEQEEDSRNAGIKASQNEEVKALSLAQQKIKERQKQKDKEFEKQVVEQLVQKHREDTTKESVELAARKRLLQDMVSNNHDQTNEKLSRKVNAAQLKNREREELDAHIGHVETLAVEQDHTRKLILKQNMNELQNQLNENRVMGQNHRSIKLVEQDAERNAQLA